MAARAGGLDIENLRKNDVILLLMGHGLEWGDMDLRSLSRDVKWDIRKLKEKKVI
ncbi:MAG: hypothetical protein GTN38_03515 [Candidatus Aenigmarchaeota archaeon]|nr:hypothetical protein [Candidatus Aenigmarchaeota archaeon]NIP40729.1 hypothetical protein [Candidatus Aenigmarchaeota archaeon]NIQ18535.1 hypothetical protein [Candidatus Aenigmarchaeota archaeon]NIS73434.1 hypothetical protein [Candidatus Aenigmarchaeota archaeon]